MNSSMPDTKNLPNKTTSDRNSNDQDPKVGDCIHRMWSTLRRRDQKKHNAASIPPPRSTTPDPREVAPKTPSTNHTQSSLQNNLDASQLVRNKKQHNGAIRTNGLLTCRRHYPTNSQRQVHMQITMHGLKHSKSVTTETITVGAGREQVLMKCEPEKATSQ
jgi:hypothetical protein